MFYFKTLHIQAIEQNEGETYPLNFILLDLVLVKKTQWLWTIVVFLPFVGIKSGGASENVLAVYKVCGGASENVLAVYTPSQHYFYICTIYCF